MNTPHLNKKKKPHKSDLKTTQFDGFVADLGGSFNFLSINSLEYACV